MSCVAREAGCAEAGKLDRNRAGTCTNQRKRAKHGLFAIKPDMAARHARGSGKPIEWGVG